MEMKSLKKTTRLLSNVDREILKGILSPDGKHSSSTLLSKKLGIPQTTIQRRRTRLEKEFLESSYSLNLEKFGWRRVDLLIYTRNGKTDSKYVVHYSERHADIDLYSRNPISKPIQIRFRSASKSQLGCVKTHPVQVMNRALLLDGIAMAVISNDDDYQTCSPNWLKVNCNTITSSRKQIYFFDIFFGNCCCLSILFCGISRNRESKG